MKYQQNEVFNVIMQGFGCMLVFNAFTATVMIEQPVIEMVYNTSSGLAHNSGYISLAVMYASTTFFNFFAPAIIALIGAKYSLVISSTILAIYTSSFFKIEGALLYAASAFAGLGSAMQWIAQGNFTTLISSKLTIGRNSGIVYALMQVRFSSLFVFFEFRNKSSISESVRNVTYAGFIGCSVLGIICYLLLRNIRDKPLDREDGSENIIPEEISRTQNMLNVAKNSLQIALSVVRSTFVLLKHRSLLLLLPMFICLGVHLGFRFAVYTTALANTRQFGSDSASLVGLHGICLGAGEVLGGIILGILGNYLVTKSRYPVIIVAFLVNIAVFYVIFINIPNDANLYPTNATTFIHPNKYVAVICSFMLGLGDGLFMTMIFSILSVIFHDQSGSAFGLFQFFLTFACSITFAVSSVVPMWYIVATIVLLLLIGTLAFIRLEYMVQFERNSIPLPPPYYNNE